MGGHDHPIARSLTQTGSSKVQNPFLSPRAYVSFLVEAAGQHLINALRNCGSFKTILSTQVLVLSGGGDNIVNKLKEFASLARIQSGSISV